jgi:hypothetical protein
MGFSFGTFGTGFGAQTYKSFKGFKGCEWVEVLAQLY